MAAPRPVEARRADRAGYARSAVGLNPWFSGTAIIVTAVLMTLPMLVLFLALQRHFIAGITAGAVK